MYDFFFFNDTATTEIYTLSLHDALPIFFVATGTNFPDALGGGPVAGGLPGPLLLVSSSSVPSEIAAELTRLDPSSVILLGRSEEDTSELQSRQYFVCRALLEKKKTQYHL